MSPHGLELGYGRALLATLPFGELLRAVARRGRRALERLSAPYHADHAARTNAAAALRRAPRLFTNASLEAHYHDLYPGALAMLAARGERLLGGEVELFGDWYALGDGFDWHRDPISGVRFDPAAPATAELPIGVDPKGVWELGRAGHLVELGAIGRLCPPLAGRTRAAIAAALGAFVNVRRLGRGVHYAAPIEVALRAVHWLAALELGGGARAFDGELVRAVGGALLEDAVWLAAHLEDQGVVPANHLLADWVGLWCIALALDGAPHMRRLAGRARDGIEREAERQVGADGAHFEASTAYHRFALELVLLAHLGARAAGRPLAVAGPLKRMLVYLRHTLAPDGQHLGFGDSDDARLVPLHPRPAAEHEPLASLGAVLFGEPELKRPGAALPPEALWLCGPEAREQWAALEARCDLPAATFPSGGVHLLRAPRWCVAMRAGSYGQHGVGGHAHNDQLGVVAWLDGRPLVIDPGTGSYTGDPLLRDRFRGTAAHATLVAEGAEQVPIDAARPFALVDRHARAHGRAERVWLEDVGTHAAVSGSHDGYLRLPARLRHHRRVTLHRGHDAVLIEDMLDGEGELGLALVFPLLEPAAPAGERACARLEAMSAGLGGELGRLEPAAMIEIGHPARAALACAAPHGSLAPVVGTAFFSPRYGVVERRPLVTFRCRLRIPSTLKTLLWAV